MNDLNFRISSALKNIIGKELITNKYVAIFELVKNSYDATAERVDIIFENDLITIKDNGKGMSLEDIKNKWLFVGYSAKADKTENDNYINYRNKISTRKNFAGAKGIGRFACDRLGDKLKLITKKDKEKSKIESIDVLWNSFEIDSKEEFVNINVKHETLQDEFGFEHGTTLEISGFRELWPEEDIKQLQRYLGRLINPNNDENDNFEIYITQNGIENKIENFIFDKLKIKTTQIIINISRSNISTELIDRGEKIYKILEENKWRDTLFDIKFILYYLNKSSKIQFAKTMGVTTAGYGSISLYKNGFRVFPFGEPGEDLLGIDKRKTQGYARFLGTRELLGKIEINNENPEFKETSSRDGGLINTKSFNDLKEIFFDFGIKRLEAYVVDALDWTFKDEDKKEGTKLQEFFPKDREDKINYLLEKLTKSKNYISTEYGYKFQEKIEDQIKKGFLGATDRIEDFAKTVGNKSLENDIKSIKETTERKKEENIVLEQNLEIEKQKSAALEIDLMSTENENILSYYHDIHLFSQNIENFTSAIIEDIKNKSFDNAIDIFDAIILENKKIMSIVEVALNRGFSENAQIKRSDIVKKIIEYLDEQKKFNKDMNIVIKNNYLKEFIIGFRYYDIVRIFSNIISNSLKHKSKNLIVTFEGNNNYLEIFISDDGSGLNEKYLSEPQKIYEVRVGNTYGAGYGLHIVKNIIEGLNGNIEAISSKKGLSHKITLKQGN